MGWAMGLFRAGRGKWGDTDFPEKIRNVLLCAFSNLKILLTSYPSDLQGPVHWLQDSFSSPYLSITITNQFIILLCIADTSVRCRYFCGNHIPTLFLYYKWLFNYPPPTPECKLLVDRKYFFFFKNPSEVKGIAFWFPRQEYSSGLLHPSPGNLTEPGIESGSLAVQADSLHSEPLGKSQ